MKTKQLTNGLLKEKMTDAMVERGYVPSLDVFLPNGIYLTYADTTCADPPTNMGIYWKYGVVEAIVRYSVCFQRLTSDLGVAMRTVNQDGTTSAWMNICSSIS